MLTGKCLATMTFRTSNNVEETKTMQCDHGDEAVLVVVHIFCFVHRCYYLYCSIAGRIQSWVLELSENIIFDVHRHNGI